jgi:hypothetical protein
MAATIPETPNIQRISQITLTIIPLDPLHTAYRFCTLHPYKPVDEWPFPGTKVALGIP